MFKALSDTGRTFFRGDNHACCDELIALGDHTNRGGKNYECVQLLSELWFNGVLGNHGEMMFNAANLRPDAKASVSAAGFMLSINGQVATMPPAATKVPDTT